MGRATKTEAVTTCYFIVFSADIGEPNARGARSISVQMDSPVAEQSRLRPSFRRLNSLTISTSDADWPLLENLFSNPIVQARSSFVQRSIPHRFVYSTM
jgi:hypothetical protein